MNKNYDEIDKMLYDKLVVLLQYDKPYNENLRKTAKKEFDNILKENLEYYDSVLLYVDEYLSGYVTAEFFANITEHCNRMNQKRLEREHLEFKEESKQLKINLSDLQKSYDEVVNNYHKLIVRVFHANNMKNFRGEYLDLKKENKELKDMIELVSKCCYED